MKLPVSLFVGRFQPFHKKRQRAKAGERRLPVALFIGRFQPFHKGHLSAIRYIAARSSRVIVAIGSAQYFGEPDNPFSAKQRLLFIKSALLEAHLLKKCRLFTLTDINSNEKWVAHLGARLPRYEVCYSNNALVLGLMRKAGKKTARIPFFKKSAYNATKIRERMRKGKEWKSRVPPAVAKSLSKMNAEKDAGI